MERLQKILAGAGLGSRRQCEILITQGRVTVDKVVVSELGTKVDPYRQEIRCDGEPIVLEKKRYYLFYKPKNVICTNSNKEKNRVIDYFSGVSTRLFTVGRLDRESEGLILVTNDGGFAQQIAHPSFRVTRMYHVVVRGNISKSSLEKVNEGIWLSVGKVKPEKVFLLHTGKKSSIIEISLKEGKNREIRRMFAQVGHPVTRLIRVQFGDFRLENIKPGQYKKIEESTIAKILADQKSHSR